MLGVQYVQPKLEAIIACAGFTPILPILSFVVCALSLVHSLHHA